MVSSRTWRTWPFGLAFFVPAAFGSADETGSASEVCFYPDGSMASDRSYYRCSGEINDKICCPIGSTCAAGGLCSTQTYDGYDVVFRGACKTKNYSHDCFPPCGSTNPSGIAFMLPCGGNYVCCGVSETDSCCANDFFWALANNFVMKSPDDPMSSMPLTRTSRWSGPSSAIQASTTTKTTTTTDTSANVPTAEPDHIGQHDAKKLVAIGAGLGVGGALLLVGVVVLVCWHVRRKKKKRRNQQAAVEEDKVVAGSEGIGTSSLDNTPVDQSQQPTAFSSLSSATHPLSRFDTFATHEQPPRSVSPLPPAPPYSPPQYESGDYQYLVVDGPTPGHSNGPGSGSGGLPVGPDGKPRLED